MRLATAATAAAMALALASCGSWQDPVLGPPPSLTGTAWQLDSYQLSDPPGRSDVPDDVTVTATFTADRLSGTTGCATYSAPYSTKDYRIDIGTVTRTPVACDRAGNAANVDAAFFEALGRADVFGLGDAFELADGNETTLDFVQLGPEVLAGASWNAERIHSADKDTTFLAGTAPTARFGTNGVLRGSAGCNTYRAIYTVDQDRINISTITADDKSCSERLNAQESSYLAVLDAARTFSITPGRLTISTKDDTSRIEFSGSAITPS